MFGSDWELCTPRGRFRLVRSRGEPDFKPTENELWALLFFAKCELETEPNARRAILALKAKLEGEQFNPQRADYLDPSECRELERWLEFAIEAGEIRFEPQRPVRTRVVAAQQQKPYTPPKPAVVEDEDRAHWVELKVTDQDGDAVGGLPYQVFQDGRKVGDGRTNAQGWARANSLDPATVEIVFPTAEPLAWNYQSPLPGKEALENITPALLPVPPAQDPAEDEPIRPTADFIVRVVDETGKQGIAGVNLVFTAAGTSKTVPTDKDGIAKHKAAADSATVKFESASDLAKLMKPIWAGRPATAEDAFQQPSADITVVASRASSIELPGNGGAFSPLSLEPGKQKTISVRPPKKRLTYIEMHDTLFRNDSAVVNPEGEAPSKVPGEHESLTTVGLVATILRYNDEHEGRKLFVAGHTDRAGESGDNDKLSVHRAKAVLALIEGNRGPFTQACKAKYSEVDVTQLMDWTNKQYSFKCRPSTLTAPPSDENYLLFRESFNKWIDDGTAAGERRGTKIDKYGRVKFQPDLWGAMFDLYEHNLRQELGEDENGVKALRGLIKWVDDGNKTIGYGEKHPTIQGTADKTRRDTDRRVEVMFFEEDDKPNLAATQGEEIYDGNTYVSSHLTPLASAQRLRALWYVAVPDWADRNGVVLRVTNGSQTVAEIPLSAAKSYGPIFEFDLSHLPSRGSYRLELLERSILLAPITVISLAQLRWVKRVQDVVGMAGHHLDTVFPGSST